MNETENKIPDRYERIKKIPQPDDESDRGIL